MLDTFVATCMYSKKRVQGARSCSLGGRVVWSQGNAAALEILMVATDSLPPSLSLHFTLPLALGCYMYILWDHIVRVHVL